MTRGGRLSSRPCSYCAESRDELRARVEDALGKRRWPCLAGRRIEVFGGAERELRSMLREVAEACWEFGEDWYNVRIVVGPDGTVADVIDRGGASVEALDCIRIALEGLEFPCLANREICPEYVICE